MLHKIELKELQEWAGKTEVAYASCKTKRLIFLLNGSWRIDVKDNGEWIKKHEGMQHFTAVETYNDLP